jgi:hypothetical protein
MRARGHGSTVAPAPVMAPMENPDPRLTAVLAAIDAANACDPSRIAIDGRHEPAELVYGRRMSATLARMAPDASVHVRIAARGQHIERWTSPRRSYPEGRVGYLKWRRDLRNFHAGRLGEIMAVAGYGADDIARVGSLVCKERLKLEPDAQLLEDVVCVVFLEHYVDDFMARTDPEKLADILAKTWAKMSPFGHEHALRLALAPAIPRLLEQGRLRQRATG